MVFSLVRCLTGLENPSQDNAEYINSGIVRRPSLVTSGATLLGITMNSRLCRVFLGQRRGGGNLESIRRVVAATVS